MHPRLAEIVNELERTRAGLLETVASATSSPVPPPGKWSVAEVLDHLAIVEQSVAGLMRKLVERAGDSLEAETSEESVLDSLDYPALADRSSRIDAPDSMRPRTGVGLDQAHAALDASRVSLVEAIERADGRALGSLSFPHRVFGPLDLYQWLLFVVQHEERHRRQIEELIGNREQTFSESDNALDKERE